MSSPISRGTWRRRGGRSRSIRGDIRPCRAGDGSDVSGRPISVSRTCRHAEPIRSHLRPIRGRLSDRARYGLGRTLAALGNGTQHRDHARADQQANPEWIDRAWLQIGLIHKSAGQFNEAVEAFAALERAVPRSPFRAEAQLQRALALVRLDRVAEAEPLLKSLAADRTASQGACDARVGDARAGTQPPGRGHENPRAGPEAFSALPIAACAPLSSGRGSRDAKSTRSCPGAIRADRRVRPQRSVGRRCSRAGRRPALPAAIPQAPGAWPPFRPSISPESARIEVRLIEARAAAQQGKHDEAVAILKSLIASPRDASKKPASAPAVPPALVEAARYELALSYRALGQPALAEPILAGLAKAGVARWPRTPSS